MNGMEWLLEIALVVLLAATLFHALRLERALGVLKRDRAALEALISGFNDSTRLAEAGIERLREMSDGAGRQIARHLESGQELREDLRYLIERGEKLADRLDRGTRSGRMAGTETASGPTVFAPQPEAGEAPRARSQAERDLMKALRMVR
jgi:hypothetical protein